MAKGNWSVVYPDKIKYLDKIFNIPISGKIYVRIYQSMRNDEVITRFQMSGDEIGFHSIELKDYDLESYIINNLPFIKVQVG